MKRQTSIHLQTPFLLRMVLTSQTLRLKTFSAQTNLWLWTSSLLKYWCTSAAIWMPSFLFIPWAKFAEVFRTCLLVIFTGKFELKKGGLSLIQLSTVSLVFTLLKNYCIFLDEIWSRLSSTCFMHACLQIFMMCITLSAQIYYTCRMLAAGLQTTGLKLSCHKKLEWGPQSKFFMTGELQTCS